MLSIGHPSGPVVAHPCHSCFRTRTLRYRSVRYHRTRMYVSPLTPETFRAAPFFCPTWATLSWPFFTTGKINDVRSDALSPGWGAENGFSYRRAPGYRERYSERPVRNVTCLMFAIDAVPAAPKYLSQAGKWPRTSAVYRRANIIETSIKSNLRKV